MSSFPIRPIFFNVLDLYKKLPAATSPRVSGSYLMGRDIVGIPIRRLVEDELTQFSSPTTSVLNFVGIKDISASVAEELGPILASVAAVRSQPEAELYLVYANLSADVRLGLDDEFRRRNQVAIAITLDEQEHAAHFSQIDLLGPPLPAPLQDVVYHCYKYGEATSADLTSENLAAASKKLTELFDKYPRLLHRTKVKGTSNPRSWQYIYYPVIQLTDIFLSSVESSK